MKDLTKITENRWLISWIVSAAIFGVMMLTLGTPKTFALWGINTTSPNFLDARGITSAIESYRLGKDPLVENPQDPLGRPLNYPRVWLGLSQLGVDQTHTALIGHGLICLFLLGLLVFPPPDLDWLGIGLMLPAAFSPAALLGMERGNIDLLMFFLTAIGIAGVAAGKPARRAMGIVSVMLGFILKLYPLFALAILIDESKRLFLRRIIWISVVAGLYVFLTRHDLVLIFQATPKATGLSYGVNVMWMELAEHSRNLGIVARLLAWITIGIAAGLIWVGHRRGLGELHGISIRNKSLIAFRAGAGVYGGTFLLGNNWDYRLIFLIFTFPLLADLIRGGSHYLRRIAAIIVIGSVISCWHITIYHVFHSLPFGSPACVILDELANWTVFLGLSFLFGITLPRWRKTVPPPAWTIAGVSANAAGSVPRINASN